MTRAIAHKGNQLTGILRQLTRQLTHQITERMDNIQVLHLIIAANVVHIAWNSLMKHHINGSTMVADVKPVAHILPIAIYRQRLTQQNIQAHQRNQLFRKLIRPIIIRAVRNQRGHSVGMEIGAR